MSAQRVLLIESLDAAGCDRADVHLRLAALRALRAKVRVAVVDAGCAGGADGTEPAGVSPVAFAEFGAGAEGLSRLRTLMREEPYDLILLAAAAPGGGPAARALPAGAPARWWPTGVTAGPGWGVRFGFDRAGRSPLGAFAGADPQTPPGLAWSSAGPRPSGRGRPGLWDGDYLLSPLPLAGDAGSRLLAAFADLPGEWCGLDLVVLSEPQPAFEREARARGIAPRVHFVGRAAREAEWAWWAQASVAVLAGSVAVSGGFVLRGLTSGCPILTCDSAGAAAAIRDWLERNDCSPVARADLERDLAGSLTAVLRRGPAVAEAVARGRVLAAEHTENRWPARLAAALPALAGDARGERRDAAA